VKNQAYEWKNLLIFFIIIICVHSVFLSFHRFHTTNFCQGMGAFVNVADSLLARYRGKIRRQYSYSDVGRRNVLGVECMLTPVNVGK
jgi:hypothetical protein